MSRSGELRHLGRAKRNYIFISPVQAVELGVNRRAPPQPMASRWFLAQGHAISSLPMNRPVGPIMKAGAP
jgi:hypothetical protein